MRSRFVDRLGPAGVVTAGDTALGFIAAVLTAVDVHLAAKVILLTAMADNLDDVVTRHCGGTDAGPCLDSLADVAPLGVALALLVVAAVREMWGFDRIRVVAGVGAATLFIATAAVRPTLYTAYNSRSDETVGVPTALAAMILSAGVLVGSVRPMSLVDLSTIMAVLMLSDMTCPDLHARDALVMGMVQGPTIVCSRTFGEGFSFGLLFLTPGYLFLGSYFYRA